MKYRCKGLLKKEENKGGDYWRDTDFDEHLKLTELQTTYQYLINNFPPDKHNILEAGCGIGRWTIPMAKKGYQVTGLEIEQEALDIIKQHYKSESLKLVQGDIFNMPFASNSFDIILSLGVLEHFEDVKVQRKAIEEHIRVLKEDGILFITVPHLSLVRLLFHFPYKKLVSAVRKYKGGKEFFTEYRYNTNTFKRIIERNNLMVKEIVYDELIPPFNFGLTVDSPLNKYFRSREGIQYKMNKKGIFLFNLLWKIHPCLVSGGVGFVCSKKTVQY